MISEQDQFAPLGRCELCGDPLTEGPKTYEGASAHTHFYDTPEEQAQYAHKLFVGRRKKTFAEATAKQADPAAALQTALNLKEPSKASPETAKDLLPLALAAPTNDLRDSIISQTLDPVAARAHLRDMVGREKGTKAPITRFDGISPTASSHAGYMGEQLQAHPAHSVFYRAHVTIKGPDNTTQYLGDHHVDSVIPTAIDGKAGISVGGSFYPDSEVHDLSYKPSDTAPRVPATSVPGRGMNENPSASSRPMSLDEQKDWYSQQAKETQASIRSEKRKHSKMAKISGKDYAEGRIKAGGSPAGVTTSGLSDKTKTLNTMVTHDVNISTAESIHNIMGTHGVDENKAHAMHNAISQGASPESVKNADISCGCSPSKRTTSI